MKKKSTKRSRITGNTVRAADRDGQEDLPFLTKEDEERIRKKKNRGLVQMSYLMVALFLSMAVYLVYFNVGLKDDMNNNSSNTKQAVYQEQIVRGNILSADGEVLARTDVADDGTETRIYPYGNVFSHVVGYESNGRSGVEAVNNYDLLSSHASILEQIRKEQLDQKVQGDSVVLTLDAGLQQACYDALGGNVGAVVVIEPSTGKILAMVSKPDFNPNTIEEDWDLLVNDSGNSSLFNRALQGQYPPGSTFKILTTLEYLREHPDDYEDFTYTCDGLITEGDVSIACYDGEVHGPVDLKSAFVDSCNGAFAEIGMDLDNAAFKELCEDFLFNQSLSLNLPYSASVFSLSEDASYGEEMMTAIGQGDTLVSPLEMALVAATVANEGTMMTPYYVDRIETYDGDVVKQYKATKYKKLMSETEVEILSDFMESVVEEGTARKLAGQAYTAAGKTGSAEYGADGNVDGTHSWFIGYLDTEDPQIAISVIVENGGTGSSAAVPVAREVFDWYFANRM